MDKTLLGHPEIIVHLGKIFVPGIDHEANYAFLFRLLPAITQRAGHECASGRATENSFLTQQVAHGGETLPVVDLECVGHQRYVSDVRDEILAYAFDGPTSCLV